MLLLLHRYGKKQLNVLTTRILEFTGGTIFFHVNRPIQTLMQSSNDVLQAFENGVKYDGLIATVLDNRLEIGKSRFSVIFEPRPNGLAKSLLLKSVP